ncbi:hypothetical protein QQF64_003179 [Cirrhinus molitorella]|uniref:Uncharacterized protein n=1 Tax=Cirrhinus molitorella TaxID=172907 RepID=A0ABR3MKV0_9TELE
MGTGRRKSCPDALSIAPLAHRPGLLVLAPDLLVFDVTEACTAVRLFSCYYQASRRPALHWWSSAELSKAPGCGDIISAYQLSAARLLAKNGFRRRKTCGPFEAGSKEEPAFPYRESNPGRLGENQES